MYFDSYMQEHMESILFHGTFPASPTGAFWRQIDAVDAATAKGADNSFDVMCIGWLLSKIKLLLPIA